MTQFHARFTFHLEKLEFITMINNEFQMSSIFLKFNVEILYVEVNEHYNVKTLDHVNCPKICAF